MRQAAGGRVDARACTLQKTQSAVMTPAWCLFLTGRRVQATEKIVTHDAALGPQHGLVSDTSRPPVASCRSRASMRFSRSMSRGVASATYHACAHSVTMIVRRDIHHLMRMLSSTRRLAVLECSSGVGSGPAYPCLRGVRC